MSKPLFTHSSGKYRIPMIGAMKKDDQSWETEEECRARVKDMFDIDDVECFWDDSLDPPGFVAGTRDSADKDEEDEGPTEAELAGDKVFEGMPEESSVEETDAEELPSHSIESKPADEPSSEPEDDSEPLNDQESSDEEIVPEKSEDGERVYELKPLKESVSGLEDYFTKWPWDPEHGTLLEKLEEEFLEAKNGTNEPISKEGDTITLVGTSTMSEVVTVAIICAKMFHSEGVSFEQFISLMCARHEEQYERYQDVRAANEADEETES